MTLGVSLPLQFFEIVSEGEVLLFSRCLIEFACEAIWSRILFVGSFLITVSISVLVMGPFIFSISSWFSLGRLYFSKKFVHFFQVFVLIGI